MSFSQELNQNYKSHNVLRYFRSCLTIWTVLLLAIQCQGIIATASCPSGLEYDCLFKVGNGSYCVLGCNITVTTLLSPNYCQGDCCKTCYTNCRHCSYIKVIVLTITNMDWKLDYQYTDTMRFANLSSHVRTAFKAVLEARNITNFSTELLKASNAHSSVTVFVKLKSRNLMLENLAIAILRNASRIGVLGALNVSLQSFEVISEAEFNERTDQKGSRETKLDVVETIVTSIAALILVSAIGTCLFFQCTTPFQRKVCCSCCKLCTNRVE